MRLWWRQEQQRAQTQNAKLNQCVFLIKRKNRRKREASVRLWHLCSENSCWLKRCVRIEFAAVLRLTLIRDTKSYFANSLTMPPTVPVSVPVSCKRRETDAAAACSSSSRHPSYFKALFLQCYQKIFAKLIFSTNGFTFSRLAAV